MITALLLIVAFWWAVIGAVVLACVQDSHRASDDRDPLVVDLPLWQVAACGPVAWLIRFFTARRLDSLERNLDALGRCNTFQIVVTVLIGLAMGYVAYLGYEADLPPWLQ